MAAPEQHTPALSSWSVVRSWEPSAGAGRRCRRTRRYATIDEGGCSEGQTELQCCEEVRTARTDTVRWKLEELESLLPFAMQHLARRLFATSARAQASKAERFTLDPKTAKFPHGFLATGLHCGVKKDPSKLDLAVIISDRPCSAAGTFTRNAFVAAPVTVSKEVLWTGQGVARGLVVNSGCANAVTGAQGLKDARAMSDQLDSYLSASTTSSGIGTLVMSTGVIGQLLPIDKILSGITASTSTLGTRYFAWSNAAKAFMTTDTFPKLRTRTFELGGKEVRMVGIDKGAGMIHPSMEGPRPPPHATMLGMIATDAAISPAALQSALVYAVDRSFNSISVDGDMSTNDTIIVLANGANGGKEITEEGAPEEYTKFRDELTSFSAELAQLIVRDGEGATKFVKIEVTVRLLALSCWADKIREHRPMRMRTRLPRPSPPPPLSRRRCTARMPTGDESSAPWATPPP